jgi:hypothetical protein
MLREDFSWTLFVDESGDFSSVADAVCIAGVLVWSEAPGVGSRELLASLRRALPGLPWPLHASVLNQPSYVAIVLERERRCRGAFPEGLPPDVAEAALAAVEFLQLAEPESIRTALEALLAGRKLPYEELERMSRRLWRERWKACRALDRHERRAWAFVRELGESLSEDGPGGGPRAVLVTAAETLDGDGGADTDARYFGLLEALLDRTAAMLERAGGRHLVCVRALGRDVREPLLGRRIPLRPQHVGTVIHRLPARARVRLLASEVARFSPEVEFPFVLADFASNRARRVLRPSETGLRQAEHELKSVLAMPVRTGSPDRTHLAATGLGSVVRRASGPADGAGAATPRRWAIEQAGEWLEGP